jgi:hypothetical protein
MNVELTTKGLLDSSKLTHDWVEKLHVCFVPGPSTEMTAEVADRLMAGFGEQDHTVQEQPDDSTDLIVTSAIFGQPLNWRKSLLFNARRRFKLKKIPGICTLVHITPDEFEANIERLKRALSPPSSAPENFTFPGLASKAHHTLYEQGKRGGPILSLERVIQAQTMCLRILLLVGYDTPEEAYLFDLVGAHPRIDGSAESFFYGDIVQRLATALSSGDVTENEAVDPPISKAVWTKMSTPGAMKKAGRELDERGFFTEMVVIDNMIDVPALNDAIANQYSEGCYSTWDPDLGVLIATITGSARPVSKGEITDNELSVIVGIQSNNMGVTTRPVDGLMNSPPSSEAFEMINMDDGLPEAKLSKVSGNGRKGFVSVPVTRSKLHGHRGVSAFDPGKVAYAPLEDAYYHYPVSCGSAAQARAIKRAFSNCEALTNPDDSRMIAFTILPGHGLFIAEKWDQAKRPFQLIWEAMDSGALQIESYVPQGEVNFNLADDGLYRLADRQYIN